MDTTGNTEDGNREQVPDIAGELKRIFNKKIRNNRSVFVLLVSFAVSQAGAERLCHFRTDNACVCKHSAGIYVAGAVFADCGRDCGYGRFQHVELYAWQAASRDRCQ